MATEKAQQFFLAWLMVFGALENTTYSQGPKSLDHIKKGLLSRQGVGYHPDPNYKLGYNTKPQLKNSRSSSYEGPSNIKTKGHDFKGGYGKEHMGHPNSKYKGPSPDYEGPGAISRHSNYKKLPPRQPRKPTNYKSNIKRNPLVSGYDSYRKPAGKTDSYNSRGSGYQKPDLGKNGYINYKPPPSVRNRLPPNPSKIGGYHGDSGNQDNYGPDSNYHGEHKGSHYHGPGPQGTRDRKYGGKGQYSRGPGYEPRGKNYGPSFKGDKYGHGRGGDSSNYRPSGSGGPRYGPKGGDRDFPYGYGESSYAPTGRGPNYGPSGRGPSYMPSGRGPSYGPSKRGPSYGPPGRGPSYGPSKRGPSYGSSGRGPSYGPSRRGPSYGPSGREKDYGPSRGTDYEPNPVNRRPNYGSGNEPGYRSQGSREANYGPPPRSRYPPRRRYPNQDTDQYTEPRPRAPRYKSTPRRYGKDPYGPGSSSHEQPEPPYRRGGPHRTPKHDYDSGEEVTKNVRDNKHYDTQNDNDNEETDDSEQNEDKKRTKRSLYWLNDPHHHSKNFYKNHGYHKNHGYYYDSDHEKTKKHYGHKYDAMKFGSFGWWKKEKENGKVKHDHKVGDEYWYGKFGKHFQTGKHRYVGKPHLG
ncbi:unnamed protein product [Owenia fusiformis]|uniref:Uncharacterized protein n=1 Tax=Owenia fusiformis TaxID=6347 RepID=A0A8J1XZJ3_OWEFU|nr:unnamed protein product [Owenia fusiformis]